MATHVRTLFRFFRISFISIIILLMRLWLKLQKELDISAAEVYGTASFYTFLDTQEKENML